MTAEEAKKNLVAYMHYAFEDLPDDVGRAIDMAIRALEQQEFILDKIRAEIHANAEMHDDGDYYLRDEWIDEIFDKYKAESEGRNEVN